MVCVFVCVCVHAQPCSRELVFITRGMYILPSHPGSFMHVQVWVGAGHGESSVSAFVQLYRDVKLMCTLSLTPKNLRRMHECHPNARVLLLDVFFKIPYSVPIPFHHSSPVILVCYMPFQVPGPWSRILGPGSLVPGPWSQVLGPRSLLPGPCSQVLGSTEYSIPYKCTICSLKPLPPNSPMVYRQC